MLFVSQRNIRPVHACLSIDIPFIISKQYVIKNKCFACCRQSERRRFVSSNTMDRISISIALRYRSTSSLPSFFPRSIVYVCSLFSQFDNICTDNVTAWTLRPPSCHALPLSFSLSLFFAPHLSLSPSPLLSPVLSFSSAACHIRESIYSWNCQWHRNICPFAYERNYSCDMWRNVHRQRDRFRWLRLLFRNDNESRTLSAILIVVQG